MPAPVAADPRAGGPVGAPARTELSLREQLSNLRGLLALSMVMTERRREEEIIHLAVTAVPALVTARPLGVLLGEGDAARWWATAGPCDAASVRSDLAAQLRRVPPTGGALVVRGEGWAWGFALRSMGEHVGHLVVGAAEAPPAADLLLLRSLAQQVGIALANARLHVSNQEANAELARTVEALRHKTAIHDRFTQVALSGAGQEGIVAALHELTGLPACVETRGGEVLAWAGPGTPRGASSPSRREQVVRRAIRDGHPIRIDGRLLTVARPRADVVGVLSLVDPEGVAGEQETVALEHAATVLAIELARLHSLAETELRLGRDLVADLVGGTGDDAHQRARALGHDLRRAHRVVVAGPGRGRTTPEQLLLQVREALASSAARTAGPPPLLMQTGQRVVALLPSSGGEDEDRLGVVARAIGPGCRLGVGTPCAAPEDFPRSYREAQLALRVSEFGGSAGPVLRYEDLGVYQLLSEVADPRTLDAFVRRWLGTLLDYDARRGGDLAVTLGRFLDLGGSYDATAADLALGRTTVRYRLRRVQQLTGHDLSDPDTRFQLHLATRAWGTLRALSGTTPP